MPPMAPPAPYAAITVAPPKPHDDPSLAAFRKELGAIAQRKDRPALAKLVLVQGFFWLKETGNAAGKKTGIEALATALSLAAKDGSGWETLGEFAADETAAPYPDRPNTVCSPAGPQFDVPALEKLAETTKTDIGDWGFTAAEGVEVRASAAQNAPVIEKLGMAVRARDARHGAEREPGLHARRRAERQGRLRGGRGDQSARLGHALLRQGRCRRLEDRRHDRRRVAAAPAAGPASRSVRKFRSAHYQKWKRALFPPASP